MATGTGYFADGFWPTYWATGYWYEVTLPFVIGPFLNFNGKWHVLERYASSQFPVVQRDPALYSVSESKSTEVFDVVEMNP